MVSKIIVLLALAASAYALPSNPGCANADVHQCVALALSAMGGSDRLAALHTIRMEVIGDTDLMEQSYRQQPFIRSYERDHVTVDLAHQRIAKTIHTVWPEADQTGAEFDRTLVVTPSGGVYRSPGGDSPCFPADIESAKQALALGPGRLLLTAAAAPDLHFAPSEILRSTPHSVVAFTWQHIPVQILLNASNHLPDAVDTTQQFKDFWTLWGDVRQRIYFDNWKLQHGVVYPTNQIIERNGSLWRSTQVLDFELNPTSTPEDNEKLFAMEAKAAAQSAQPRSAAAYRLDNAKRVQLAPGVDFFPGPWNATLIKQADGVVVLETPISARYTEGIFAKAHELYPGAPIKAVLSTSDSWPHVGGVRYDVAQRIPVYILDLNQPLLDRMMAAPHALEPDPLQLEASGQAPRWKIVSGKTEVGSGANRVVLYPLRGASTERQYMVYFPEHRLLYASDTLVLNPDHSLYDPELMREVAQAAAREGLGVDTVFAMHQGPTPWKQVISLLDEAN